MASTLAKNQIPTFYWVLFAIIDPLLASSGVVLNLLSPLTTIQMWFVQPIASVPPSTTVLLDGMAGVFAGYVILQVYLLRYTSDLTVWKCVQLSIALNDFFMLKGCLAAIASEDRLELAKWVPNDYANVIIYTFLGVVRCAFAAGIGLPASSRPKKA